MATNQIASRISSAQLMKPQKDTNFAHQAAKLLVDIIEQNGWAKSFGGQSKHLQYEAWQTAGKFYGYSVKTGEANYVEYGGVKGFEAKAWVIDNKTGLEVGGAEAACMSDEPNWKNKPLFQLKSMAQTRAGSKALRQILGFVVALAGYNPTPSEEMIVVDPKLSGEDVTFSPAFSREKVIDKPTTGTQGFDRCSHCNVVITQAVLKYSTDKYSKALCMICQKEEGKEDAKWIQDDGYLKT